MLHKTLMSNNHGTRKAALKIVTVGITLKRVTLDNEGVMLTIAIGDAVLILLLRRFFLFK